MKHLITVNFIIFKNIQNRTITSTRTNIRNYYGKHRHTCCLDARPRRSLRCHSSSLYKVISDSSSKDRKFRPQNATSLLNIEPPCDTESLFPCSFVSLLSNVLKYFAALGLLDRLVWQLVVNICWTASSIWKKSRICHIQNICANKSTSLWSFITYISCCYVFTWNGMTSVTIVAKNKTWVRWSSGNCGRYSNIVNIQFCCSCNFNFFPWSYKSKWDDTSKIRMSTGLFIHCDCESNFYSKKKDCKCPHGAIATTLSSPFHLLR